MKRAVLIVDDSLTVRMDLKEGFEAAGFTVTTCATLGAARESLTQGTFRVIILDVVLPDGDGIEFLKELRENPETAELAVLLLSTEVEIGERLRGLTTGADDYVGKPYERSYVVERAREFLTKRGAPPPAPRSSPLILLIDDSATFRSALRAALEGAGYAVEEAGSGEDGLRLAAAVRPSAAIVDGMLPGLGGAAVIRRMGSDPALRRTPCLLLTGSGERHEALNALEAGADTYLRKDADLAIIMARLSALLRASARPAAVEMVGSLFASKKLLAVDDSLTYLETLSATLRHEGYDVIQARSGDEALALLAVQAVDAILLDMIMPGLSGQETCRRIKVTWRDIPVLMLSAREDREAVIEAFDAGADDYVPKSSEGEVLLARLRAELRRRQFEEENRKIQEEIQRKEVAAAEAKAYRAVAEERLREAETRYRALVETTPAITYSADLSGETKLLYVSPQTEGLLGFGAEEWLADATHWVKRIHPEDRDRVLEAFERTRSEGVPFKMEYRLMTSDGHPRWFHDHGLVITEAPRNKRTMYGTIVDITERKQVEEALRRLNEELDERIRLRTAELTAANRELEAFSYSVSHDLRAPLRHIDGFVGLLAKHLDPSLDAQGRRYLTKVSESAKRMGELIDDLLAFSRVGRADLRRTRVDSAGLVRDVLRILEPETAGRNIDWVIDELPEVQGDPQLLWLVLQNLIGNALKYTRPRSQARIELSATRAGSETVFSIRDNGVGFDMRHAERLFGVFQRLHKSAEFEGTGIGLANVSRIILRHGGRVWAEGAVDKGACFYFSLPNELPVLRE